MTKTKSKIQGSEYINEARKRYAMYTIQDRAIPAITDGLKTSARRVLWTARDGKKWKSAALAGTTMSIHPHAAPEGTVNTLAAPYGNNIPLLNGIGTFGTLLNPTGYGASRYTTVEISDFTKDVVFRDIEIIPMTENYDMTCEEPVHFLPLVPIVLLNPSEGIALAFRSDILPRSLRDIINSQIKFLENVSERKEPNIKFSPFNAEATNCTTLEDGRNRWTFRGTFNRVSKTTVRITSLPYTLSHFEYTDTLNDLKLKKDIISVEDNSSDHIDILVKIGSQMGDMDDEEIINLLGLEVHKNEFLNVVDFDGEHIVLLNYKQIIESFTEWRLSFFKPRYQRLHDLIEVDIQKYRDIITAIDNDAGGKARSLMDRESFKVWLKKLKIVHLDYIASLPVYRFTKAEKKQVQEKLKEAEKQLREYKSIIRSKQKQIDIYKAELKDVLKQYG